MLLNIHIFSILKFMTYIVSLTAEMKSFLFFCLLALLTLSPEAQDIPFTPLKNDPQKDKEFLSAIENRYKEYLSLLNGKHKKNLLEIYKYRYEMIIERFDQNEVMTNEKTLAYLKAILDEILKANPLEQPSNIRMAFLRNWWTP